MALNGKSPHDISEDDIKIESKSWDHDDCQTLWARHTLICEKMGQYWEPYLSRGKTCFDYEKGDIFTAKQAAYYRDKEDKYPIQPRLMESRIYSLAGEIMKGRRSGSITTEGGSFENPAESATKVSLANLAMKCMEKEFKERRLTKDLLHDGLVACYPVWAWVEKGLPSKGEGVLTAALLPWDSVAVAPFHFRYPEEVTGVRYRSFLKEAELIDRFPDMKDQIKAHQEKVKEKDFSLLSSINEWDVSFSAGERSSLHSIASTGATQASVPSGYYVVDTRVFVLMRKETVAINMENLEDFQIKPPEWEPERWQAFIEERRQKGVEYVEDERVVRVLWQTVGTTSGLMLENKKHWFQKNGRMPGSMFQAAMIDMEPSGPGEKMLDKILTIACADTEFLDEVRKGAGNLWLMREGYISNIDKFQTEVSKNSGALLIKREWPGQLEGVVKNVARQPNKATYEYGQIKRNELDQETRINQAMQGENNPNQAAIAKSMELAQGLISQSEYVENFNVWWEDFQDLKCSLIPMRYSQYDILEIIDEQSNAPVSAEVNAPEFDMTGEIIGMVNDLTACEFKFRIQPVDDSPTAKEAERQQAMIFLNAVPGPLAAIDPSGELLAILMAAMPNRLLQDAGKRLQGLAKQRAAAQQQSEQTRQMLEANEKLMKLKNEAEKIKNSKVALSFSGEQMAMYPVLMQLLQSIGYFSPDQTQLPPEAQAQGMAMGAAAGAPAPVGAPAGMGV